MTGQPRIAPLHGGMLCYRTGPEPRSTLQLLVGHLFADGTTVTQPLRIHYKSACRQIGADPVVQAEDRLPAIRANSTGLRKIK